MRQAEQSAAFLRPSRVRGRVGRVVADRITTPEEWVAGSRKAAGLDDHVFRYLLLPAADDPDHFWARPMLGQARELGAAGYLCETPGGSVVLSADTLVYWH